VCHRRPGKTGRRPGVARCPACGNGVLVPRRTVVSTVAASLGLAVTIAVVAFGLTFFIVPRAMGGDSMTVLSGSMEPTINTGDVAMTRGVLPADVCADVRIGDIVTYLPEPNDPTRVTHRVVAKTVGTFDDGTACRLVTQGDANTAEELVSPLQVRGVVVYVVPKLGWARQWVTDERQSILVVAGVVVVGLVLWDLVRPPRTRVVTYTSPPGSGPPPPRRPGRHEGVAADEETVLADAPGAPVGGPW